jgi:phosphoenolpyruvate-protein kinase (PTS system EI component)
VSFVLDPTTVGVIFAVVAVGFSVVYAVLISKGIRIGKKWTSLKESELESKPEKSIESDVHMLTVAMDDVKHRLDGIETALDEIRELLRSTV